MIHRSVGYAFLAALAGSIVACGSGPSDKTAPTGSAPFIKDSLIVDIKTLASDSFQGRRPFTNGEKKTIDYLVGAYSSLGLEPGNGNSYTQDVPLVEISPAAPSAMSFNSTKGNISLQNMEDFVLWTEKPDSLNVVDKSDVIFAGFGVVAPEYNWNDYAGLDVRGKTVLVMVNDPGFYDSTLFKGHTMTYYGRWTYKYEEASRQGAKACIIIHNTKAASYPFAVVQNSNGGVKLHLDTRANPSYQLTVQGWITEPMAFKLLAAGGRDSSLLEAARKRGFKAQQLKLQLSAAVHTKEVYNMSHNVVAKITGTKYPDEYLIYSAHWDHLGIGKPDAKGDSIYNGAADNASGTAAILEIARAFKNGPKPERTIVFLSVTAEEQGLLGSAYYSQHPVYPLAKTVADLNLDVLNTYGPTKDITYSGKGQSELEDYVAAEAKKADRYVAPEDNPEAGHYFRSDHFNFARVGVPSISADGGVDDRTQGTSFGKKKHEEYTEQRYHQPADEYNASAWNLDGALEDMALVYKIGLRLANGHEWPGWKAGSEFKAIRDRSAQDRK